MLDDGSRLDDVFLDALAHLICSDGRDLEAPTRDVLEDGRRIRARDFDGFEPIEAMDRSDFLLLPKNAADLPVWPLDVTIAKRSLPDTGWPDGTWHFARVRTLTSTRWRGRLALHSPRMVEYLFRASMPDGTQFSSMLPLAILNGRVVNALRKAVGGQRISGYGDFIYANVPSAYGWALKARGHDEFMASMFQMIPGWSLRREYLWSVLLGEGGGPRARFSTDPTGVRAAFRLRDIPPGRERRAALRHWVREHWRQSRSDRGDRAFVREHLRGATEFTWNGLTCAIHPSLEDSRRNTVAGRVRA